MDRIIAAMTSAKALARVHGAKIAIAAFDGGGRCLGSARMNGTSWLLEEDARATAFACASLGMDAAKIAKLRGQPWLEDLLSRRPDMRMSGGSAVVKENGAVTAAFGVTGASDEIDAICAKRAVSAFRAASAQEPRITDDNFRRTMATLPTGVTVITTVDRVSGEPRGMTANSVTSISRNPPIVGLFVGTMTQSYRPFVECEGFAVSVLHTKQSDLALALAKSGAGKFKGMALGTSPGGFPVIPGSVTSFECQTTGVIDIGDHVMVWGEMVWADEVSPGHMPLVFLGGGRFGLASAEAGAGAGAGFGALGFEARDPQNQPGTSL